MNNENITRRTALQRIGLGTAAAYAATISGHDGQLRGDPQFQDPTLKARLILIGGGTSPPPDTPLSPDIGVMDPTGMFRIIWDRIRAGKDKPVKVTIINCGVATDERAKISTEYNAHLFKLLGGDKVDVHFLSSFERATYNGPAAEELLATSDVVMVSGGDQDKVSRLMRGTRAHKILVSRCMNDPDFTYIGNSAGTALVSSSMLTDHDNNKQDCNIAHGFGLLNVPFDTHVDGRDREWRVPTIMLGELRHDIVHTKSDTLSINLLQEHDLDLRADQMKGATIGISIDEGTAAEIYKGHLTVLGKGVRSPRDDEALKNWGRVIISVKDAGNGIEQYICRDGRCIPLGQHAQCPTTSTMLASPAGAEISP